MFNLRGFLSTLKPQSNNNYTPASSLIQKGSILDRRKLSNERRAIANRRKGLSKIIKNLKKEQRKINDRRCIQKRRCAKELQSNDKTNNIENEKNKKQKLSIVEILKDEHFEIIEIVNQLSMSAQLMNFSVLDTRIERLRTSIKSHFSKEENLLDIYIKAPKNKSNKKIKKQLSALRLYIYNTGDGVFQTLDKYDSTKVTDVNVELFLEDMDRISDTLNDSFKQKEEHLYDLYSDLPNIMINK